MEMILPLSERVDTKRYFKIPRSTTNNVLRVLMTSMYQCVPRYNDIHVPRWLIQLEDVARDVHVLRYWDRIAAGSSCLSIYTVLKMFKSPSVQCLAAVNCTVTNIKYS